jgi:hypothetical protein
MTTTTTTTTITTTTTTTTTIAKTARSNNDFLTGKVSCFRISSRSHCEVMNYAHPQTQASAQQVTLLYAARARPIA